MGAEPEGVAAVEGDKPTPCPTCGGPCTKEAQSAVEMAMMATPHYRSLVKGEVVAEGLVDELQLKKWNDSLWRGGPLPVWKKGTETDGDIPVLVIRAKENAGTGGKE
jgi:hypothetical protein